MSINVKQQLGISAFNTFSVKEFGWIFREQPILDCGIDATLEQVENDNPTGKMIGVQIKTGRGNVYRDRNNNWVYYMSHVHHDYWLSYSLPVIIVFYDDEEDTLFWKPIIKSQIEETIDRYKITFSTSDICNVSMKAELEKTINYYSPSLLTSVNVKNWNISEVKEYVEELFLHTQEIIKNLRFDIEQFGNNYERIISNGSVALHANTSNFIKAFNRKIALCCNVATTNIKNKIPTFSSVCNEAIIKTKELITKIKEVFPDDYESIKVVVLKEAKCWSEQLDSLDKKLEEVYDSFSNPPQYSTHELRTSYNNFSFATDNFRNELKDIMNIIKNLFLDGI